MSSIIVRKINPSEFQTAAPLLFSSSHTELLKQGIVFLAYAGEEPCGALGALEGQDLLQVVSLYVKEAFRRQGAASALLHALEALAREREIGEVNCVYAAASEQAQNLDVFFVKQGYSLPITGDTLYSIPFEELKNSVFAGQKSSGNWADSIIPLAHLNGGAADSVKTATGRSVTDYLSQAQKTGKIRSDLSLAFVVNHQVTALIVVTEDRNVLHLNDAFLSSQMRAAHLIALLEQAFRLASEQAVKATAFTVTGATESGVNLIEKLLSVCPMEETAIYTAVKMISMGVEYLPPEGYGEALARLQTISDVLLNKGSGVSMVLIDGSLPYLELPFGERDQFMELHCHVDEEEAGVRYTLIAETVFHPAEESTKHAILTELEEQPYYGISGESGELYIRDLTDELELYDEGEDDASTFDPEHLVSDVVLPYKAYMEELCRRYEGSL